MAKPTTARGTKLRILMGDDSDPIVYTAYCGLTAKTIRFQSQTNDFYVPDCDNPDDPAWREIVKSGRSVSIQGQGLLDTKDALPRMQDAYNSDLPVPMKVELNIPALSGGGAWVGEFMCTQLEITGNDADLVQANITLESNGEIEWVPAS